MDDASLRQAISRVLRDPSVDMDSVTPAQVRAALVMAGELSEEEAHEQRKAIKAIVGEIFWKIREEREAGGGEEDGNEDGNTEQDTASHAEEEEDVLMDEEELKPKKKATKKKKSSKGMTDEELAKKLSREVNAGSRSRKNGGGKDSAGGKGIRKKKKSADIVDSDGEGSEDEGKPKKKRAAGGGFKKEYTLSLPLAEIVEAEKMSRPQVVKHLWDYIKGRELQNPNDKREIVCDDKLRAMFGVDRINMFKMNKVLGEHLHEAS